MAESNQHPPLSNPPSPHTANDAIAAAHHGGDVSSLPRTNVSGVLFAPGDDGNSPPIIDGPTPVPSKRKRSAPSSRTTSSKKSKSSNQSEINRAECLTTGFHLWSREALYEASNDIASSDDAFDAYEAQFSRQITYRFRLEHETKKKKRESLSSSTKRTRSNTSITPVSSDQNAASLTTDDPRRLSRLHWEDIIRCQAGHRLKLYVAKDAVNQQDAWWDDTFSSVVKELSLKPTLFNKTAMYCMDVSILEASLHSEIFKGDHSISSLQRMFKRGDGFSINFTGTKETTLSVAWKKMLYSGSDIMFFDSPLPRNRAYNELFKNKHTICSIRQVFHSVSLETAGDYSASSALLIAYLKREKEILKNLLSKETEDPHLCDRDEFVPAGGSSLLKDIDDKCKEMILAATYHWTNYQSPLLTDDDYKAWIERMQIAFPLLWQQLSHFRDVESIKTKHLVPGKKAQVFHQILTLLRQRDPRLLKWWAMIEAMGLLSWGVGRSALETLSYFGSHVSPSTRDRMLLELFGDSYYEKIQSTLSSVNMIIFIIDNYQIGQQLKNQRGEHSSNFMSGTNMIAERPRTYDDPLYNNIKPKKELQYVFGDSCPSPSWMVAYELFDPKSPAEFFKSHKDMESVSKPCLLGHRVKSYTELIYKANYLRHIRQSIIESHDTTHFFPKQLNQKAVNDFKNICTSRDGGQLFASAKEFQRQAVLKWNPHADDITDTLLLGMNPLDEAASTETGAILLKLLSDAGLLTMKNDGSWEAGDLSKFVLFYGDLKTVDNINLLQKNIRESMNGKGFSQLKKQLDTFDKVLDRVMDLPGDWHAGLSMLTSIYILFYTPLLEPIQKLLKWKRLTQDTRKCYYQAGRLVMLVNTVLHKVLLETFLATKLTTLKNDFKGMVDKQKYSDSHGDFICYCASQYDDFLESGMNSKDDWRRLCCVFLLMTNDYLLFVSSYRKCDSIMVEHIYDRFGPVWRCLGQTRYLERVWRQQEVLYTKFDHQALQTQRINRFSRPYHGSSGKGAHAKDEKLELFNWEYSKYPKPRSKSSFVVRSKFVGVGKKSKATIQQYYTIKWASEKNPPKSASTKFDKPQFVFVYEIFCKTNTSIVDTCRQMTKNYVSTFAKGLTTKLKLESVESRSRCAVDDPSLALLSTLRQGLASTSSSKDTNNDDEEPNGVDDDMQMMNKDDLRNVDETEEPIEDENVRLTNEKAGFNVQCMTNIWRVGSDKIKSDGIQEQRTNKKKRYERSKEMMREMGNLIEKTRSLIEGAGTLKEECEEYERQDFMTVIDELNVFKK